VRELLRLHWQRDAAGLAVLDVRADAFCHHMVRALVGALLAVGDGRRSSGWPGEVLRAARRDPTVQVVPAHGLTLESVGYPADHALAARARETRRSRTERA
jgi:tRNA pseudouridine38-40 synthase